MAVSKELCGRYVRLRAAEERDAEFSLALRMDEKYAHCFPTFKGTVESQIEWIREQRKKMGDYLFIVENKKGEKIGIDSVYNQNCNEIEIGRTIMTGNSMESIESHYLLIVFSFYTLNVDRIVACVFEDNESSIRYNYPFGGTVKDSEIVVDNRKMKQVEIRKVDFEKAKRKVERYLYRCRQI